jgi:formylglycine-generating enzyme required for sulfatase activity
VSGTTGGGARHERGSARLFALALAGASLAIPGASDAGETKKVRAEDGVVTLRAPAEGRVLIRKSSFMMGSDVPEIGLAASMCAAEPAGTKCKVKLFEDEYGPHGVTVDDYMLDRLEVTVGDYDRCVASGECDARPIAGGGKRFERSDWPVTMVSWFDAKKYCVSRGGRLPTEAEWERAARGTKGRRYPWGNVFDPYLVNGGRFAIDPFEDKDGYAELAPVGSFPEGKTPDGVLDLAGNAEEWVADWWAPEYPENAQVNPKGPDSGEARVTRGGSYVAGRAFLRGAAREPALPSSRAAWLGFRCAYDANADSGSSSGAKAR